MLSIMKSHAILGGLLTFFVVHDVKTQIEAARAAKIYMDGHAFHQDIIAAQEAQINYMTHLLSENGVEVDDFDMIALNFGVS